MVGSGNVVAKFYEKLKDLFILLEIPEQWLVFHERFSVSTIKCSDTFLFWWQENHFSIIDLITKNTVKLIFGYLV